MTPCVAAFFMAGKITALQAQKRNKNRVNVFLDGQFAFAVFDVEAARLRIGQWLDDSEINALKSADTREKAHQQALHFLSYRPRSCQEIHRNLVSKGFDDQTIEACLQRLQAAGLADDEAFARYWLEQRQQFRPRSAAMLRYELRQKGIAPQIVDQALFAIDEEALAYEAARKRAHTLSPEDFRRKLSAYLARRGFPYPVIRETVERLHDELDLKLENHT